MSKIDLSKALENVDKIVPLNEKVQLEANPPKIKPSVTARTTIEVLVEQAEKLNDQRTQAVNELIELEQDLELLLARIDQKRADINALAKEITIVQTAAGQTKEIIQSVPDITEPKKEKKHD